MAATAFTAKDIQELRQRTGAGMMECKKALEETQGNVEQAVEHLRKKGIAKAERRVGRAATEGRILGRASDDGRIGVLLELNSETDFVSRNAEFGELVRSLAHQLHGETSVDGIVGNAADGALLGRPWHADESRTVAEIVKQASGKTGENIVLRRYARFVSDGAVGVYVHHNGKLGVMVDVGGASGPAVQQLAGAVAEHIAAGVPRVPLGVSRADLADDYVARERSIFEAQAREQGKPDSVRDRIVAGQVEKLYKENALLEQPWVRDDSRNIGALVAEAGRQAGAELHVRRFVRFQMGEE